MWTICAHRSSAGAWCCTAGEAGWARASGYAGVQGGVVDVNQPSICLYFAPCADLTSLRIVPEGEAGFTLNLSGEKGTE